MSLLFSSIDVKSITFKNRIITSPMCMYSAVDGIATDWHLVHYGSRAMGGSGTVMVEATAVQADGRIAIGDLGIYNDEQIPGLKKIASFIKNCGSVPAIQLAHSGRKGSTWVSGGDGRILLPSEGGWELIAPSPLPFSDMPVPREMNLEDIEAIKVAFALAAKRALTAGFELIEIHSAHGYLLHEFLSPVTNLRKDEYGGNLENRAKLLFEVIERVKEEWPDNLPISVRISATDWVEHGWTVENSIWLTRELAKVGVDIIDVSTGGLVPDAKIPVGAGYQLPFASAIKKDLKEEILVGTVGLIDTPQQAETILVNGDADFIFIGRELLRDPYFPLHAAKVLRSTVNPPKQYERAF
ncbi:NADH:flavin oxidoreductase/NADH oxidase [Sphingobacterium sp. LRF_L2]|uniref:NADH:flavin oxidoreductase/NADH oxidase n=1 Tax=Sphingobacterium sp. LRF_L2 TaxID=3369421 RepID=UPI003F5F554E